MKRLLSFLLIITFSSCSQNEHELKVGDKITRKGLYRSKEKNILLEVLSVNNCVEYKLYSLEKDVLYNSLAIENSTGYWGHLYEDGTIRKIQVKTPKASIFNKWYFVLKENGNLEFTSSDIGSYILKSNSGRYILERDSIYSKH